MDDAEVVALVRSFNEKLARFERVTDELRQAMIESNRRSLEMTANWERAQRVWARIERQGVERGKRLDQQKKT